MMKENSSICGLDDQQVKDRIEIGQVNRIKTKTSRTFLSIFCSNVFTLFNLILTICFTAILLFGEIKDGLFVVVLFLNIIIGVTTECRAKITLDNLTLKNANKITVIRGENHIDIDPNDIVLDEIIELKNGDQIPVDGEIIESKGLSVDESMITGESISVEKEENDFVFSGSFVIGGAALFKATKVGENSHINQLSKQAKNWEKVNSDLINGINRILTVVSICLVPFILLIVWAQYNVSGTNLVTGVVASIVGVIPSGLVLLTSFNFAIAVIVLAKKNTLIQELPAVEILAKVDSLLLDKTGTITDGSMKLHDIFWIDKGQVNPLFLLTHKTNKTGEVISNHLSNSYVLQDIDYKILENKPFNSSDKFSMIKVLDNSNKITTSYYLGAPEVFFDKKSIPPKVIHLQNKGLRVLIFCKKKDEYFKTVAIIALQEQIRDDINKTLMFLSNQNVNMWIVSGDNENTVSHVAKNIDALKYFNSSHVNEIYLNGKIDYNKLLDFRIIGRATPSDKQNIIQCLKDNNHTVAMTGDGINDIPALKSADLSISMQSGSVATKAISKIVLLNNKISNLPAVLGHGRRIIANMENVATFFLTKTFYMITISLATILLQKQFPILPRQMTIIGAFTIAIPAFIFAIQPNNTRYRPHFLKRVLCFTIPAGFTIGVCPILFLLNVDKGDLPSISTLILILLATFVLFLSVKNKNLINIFVIVICFALSLLTYLPQFYFFFELRLPLNYIFPIIVVCLISFFALTFIKKITNKIIK